MASKTRKKRRHQSSAAETLEEIQHGGDRLVQWVGENPMPILGVALVILLIAGIFGLTRDTLDSGDSESATALAQVQGDYRIGMGATPGAIEIPEPANPATAERIRKEIIARYEAISTEYAGSTAAAVALLEAGKLQQQLGEIDAAQATFERGLGQVSMDQSVRAFLLTRLASVHEAAGRYSEAAAAYEEAARVPGYPLRFDALAEAARTYAEAGESQKALAAYDRIRTEVPDYRVAPYIEARLRELRIASRTD